GRANPSPAARPAGLRSTWATTARPCGCPTAPGCSIRSSAWTAPTAIAVSGCCHPMAGASSARCATRPPPPPIRPMSSPSLDPTTIVYLAERVGYERPCQGCPIDTLRTGVDVVRLDLSSDATSLAAVPGTRFASAVARGESADVIYYTLGGDSRVYRRVLST